MAKISLNNMIFFGYHGCFEEEQVIGNNYSVSVSFVFNTKTAEKTDNLEDTVNYQTIYDLIKKEMAITSKLIEHVARRIFNAIQNEFKDITELKVKLKKLKPNLGGIVESAEIVIN